MEAGFPRVRVIRNLVNLGFAAANNQALRDLRTEYVLLLNPDTVIEEDGLLAGWIAFMDAHSEVAAAGCRLVHRDGREQVGDGGFAPPCGRSSTTRSSCPGSGRGPSPGSS